MSIFIYDPIEITSRGGRLTVTGAIAEGYKRSEKDFPAVTDKKISGLLLKAITNMLLLAVEIDVILKNLRNFLSSKAIFLVGSFLFRKY